MTHISSATHNIPSKSEFINSISPSNDTILNEILKKDKRQLVEELLWLRKTCKTALKESWKKVEDLRCHCATYVEVEMELDAKLIESRIGEETWRVRCLTAENINEMHLFGRLGGIDENCSHVANTNIQKLSKPHHLLTCRNEMRPWSSRRGLDGDAKRPLSTAQGGKSVTLITRSRTSMYSSNRDDVFCRAAKKNMQQILDLSTASPSISTSFHESMSSLSIGNSHGSNTAITSKEECLIDTDIQTAGETSKPSQFCLRGNAKSQEDLSLRISSRDESITSLEQTLYQLSNDMQNMHHEMVCSMKTQRIKEERIYGSHKQKEDRLDKLVVSLRGKLETNNILSQNQDKHLSELKLYIQELSDELEILLKVVERAKEGGFVLDCNPSL